MHEDIYKPKPNPSINNPPSVKHFKHILLRIDKTDERTHYQDNKRKIHQVYVFITSHMEQDENKHPDREEVLRHLF